MKATLQQKIKVIIIGKESVGKSQLIASLTHKSAYISNFPGTTVNCESYQDELYNFIDTPGIFRASDSQITATVLKHLPEGARILLVVQATHINDDLADLLPLVTGKQGTVIVTFWDKVSTSSAKKILAQFQSLEGIDFIPVDARQLKTLDRVRIFERINCPQIFTLEALSTSIGCPIEPSPTLLENPYWGTTWSIVLLLLPAIVAVMSANLLASSIDPLVQKAIAPLWELMQPFPKLLKDLFIGSYGLVTMGPLLFVWAIPTVILYAFFLGVYKASGLLDRITTTLHSLMRPFGLTGRDLVRVIMGFGCNVPAVISTRACSGCSRGTCIKAIAFGSACSYQFGATLAVFAAVERPVLIIPYLSYLTLTSLIYTRLTAPKQATSPLNTLAISGRSFLEMPRWNAIWREVSITLSQFFFNAIPVFILITLFASLLDSIGFLNSLGRILSSAMGLFNLPSEAALPIVLASIRKDGILLFAQPDVLISLNSAQILTGVYLASVILPCLVTLLTIVKEKSWHFALKLLQEQMTAAIVFSLILAWGSLLFTS